MKAQSSESTGAARHRDKIGNGGKREKKKKEKMSGREFSVNFAAGDYANVRVGYKEVDRSKRKEKEGERKNQTKVKRTRSQIQGMNFLLVITTFAIKPFGKATLNLMRFPY